MTRFDRTVLTAIVLASGLAVAGYLYAQTATLKGKQVRVIDATDATINLHTSDSSGVNLVESRLLNGNEYEFYTGSSVSTAVEFISGITTWMDLSSPGLVSVQPRFPVGFSLQGSFLSTAGGSFAGRISSTVTDATEAYSIESSDSNKDWYILGDTSMCWGDPTCDTTLYRSAADTLKTDDTFIAAAGMESTTETQGDSDTSVATTDFVDRRFQQECKTIDSLVAADDNVLVWVPRLASTIEAVACQSDAAATVVLEDFGGTTIETLVCETDGAIAWDASISGTATLIVGEVMRMDTTSASTPTWTMICWAWSND